MKNKKPNFSNINFYNHDIYVEHLKGVKHPESPERIRTIMNSLREDEDFKSLEIQKPSLPDPYWLRQIHSKKYIEFVKQACGPKPKYLDPDTIVTEKSYLTSFYAAGAVINAIDSLLGSKVNKHSFCASRPPGHHAGPDYSSGFCLFNHISIGANYAIEKYGLNKVFILDWDVHHGNGTQHIFEQRNDAFYCSLHQWPLFPGSGKADETGSGRGKGYTLNIPLSSGIDHKSYLSVFSGKVLPALEKYQPDLIMISCGFDAYFEDPLAGLSLTEDTFLTLTDIICQYAKNTPAGKLISVLEGGYHLGKLPELTKIHLTRLAMN